MPPQANRAGDGALRDDVQRALGLLHPDVPATGEARQRATLRGRDTHGRERQIAHAGLALDRYLTEPAGANKSEALHALYEYVAELPPPALYRSAFDRWQTTLRLQESAGVSAALAERVYSVRGRMIVGLGAETVRETAVTLHRLYGVPFIPGSALKGLAHHYARYLCAEAERRGDAGATRTITEQMAVLFGTPPDKKTGGSGEAGYVTYHDAWYVPGTPRDRPDRPLALDVITVHHPDYYQKRGAVAPTDFDDPVPTAFLSARGDYLVAVLGPTQEWAQLAQDLLERALADWGIGGKTSSGYGRLVPA